MNDNSKNDKWFSKFQKSSSIQKNKKNNDYSKSYKKEQVEQINKTTKKEDFSVNAKLLSSSSMFNQKKLQKDAQAVLDNFDNIVQSIKPLNTKQIAKLPSSINNLSHQLTDQRDKRRVGYMNSTEELSSYVRYFSWWNLVRLTKIFSNMKEEDFILNDNDFCIDFGSGPLTVVIALWLARPELREKKLTWYCVDISQSSLSLGEDLYLSIAAKTPPKNKEANPNWNIIRIKGELGTSIKNKASFITSANMFNEINQKSSLPTEQLTKNHIASILSYAKKDASIFIAEPGIPTSANFIALSRDEFISNNYKIISPCPHEKKCPMHGTHAKLGGKTKWCNFAFTTEKAPNKLLKLSNDANLPKERAVISFVFASNLYKNAKNTLDLRIASDSFWLPGNNSGFYCCSNLGLILLVNKSKHNLSSGSLLTIQLDSTQLKTDPKTQAKIIVI